VKTIPLRHLAEINPPSGFFEALPAEADVLFLPLETVWADGRADQTRRVRKSSVESGYTRFHPGDTVCPKVTPTFQAGRSMRANAVGAGTTELHVLRPRVGVDPRWVTYAVRSKHFLEEGVTAFQGVAGLQRVPQEFVANFRVADVPMGEQRRIADFLDDRVARIDQIIAARETQLQALEPLRRAAVVTALNDELRVPLRRLLSRIVTGGTPSAEMDDPSGLSWYSPGGFSPALTLGDPTRRVSPEDAVLFRAQSVLIVGIGATAGKVAWLDHRGSGNQQLTCLEHDPQRAEGRFLLHQLDAMRDGILRQAPLATLPILNNEFVKSIDVAVPELSQQRRLARQWDARLSEDTATAGSLTRSIALLGEYKQSLITAAVTGEIDVATAGSGVPR